MILPRRQFLHLAAGAISIPAVSRAAWALNYPTRPVSLIIGYAAGGPTDIVGRLIGQCLSERLGQQFIIVNRPGAGSNVGTEYVVDASPNGYTLLLVTHSNAFNATLYDNLSFNFIRDIAPVAGIMRVPNVMEINLSVPAKSVPEFIAYAKANPGKINMATGGIGSAAHVYGELFKMMTGIDLVPVHYRGTGPALIDLLGGQVQVVFDPIVSSIAYIKTRKLRPLAVTTATRSPVLPDIPTVSEFVPGYDAGAFYGIGAPKNTPTEIVDKLNEEINACLADPKFTARLGDLGGTVIAGSPADFGKLMADEIEKWGKVIRAGNMTSK